MNDSLGVRRVQSVGNLNGQVQELFGLEGLLDPVLERLPVEKFHGYKGLAFVLVNVVDRANVRMVQGGCGTGFTLKTLKRLEILS